MTDESARTLDNPGCLSLFVAVALAALLLALTILPLSLATPMIYLPIFGVTAAVAILIGLPLYLLARFLQLDNVWTALLAGALTGAALPMMIESSDGLWRTTLPFEAHAAWLVIAGYAAVGAIGGLAFYLTATAPRAPRRNLWLLLALAATSAVAAPLTVAWLSPPVPSSAAR